MSNFWKCPVYIITIESRKNHNRFSYTNNCQFQIVFNFWISVCIKLSFGDGQWIHYKAKKACMVVVVRRSLAVTLYYGKNVIWNDFKSNHIIPNQIQIKSHVFQIKSLFFKSNHYVWFNHDLNQIMIWICPSLVKTMQPPPRYNAIYNCLKADILIKK